MEAWDSKVLTNDSALDSPKGKIVSKEEKEKIKEQLKGQLEETILCKMQEVENKDIEIKNVRLYFAGDKKYALADVSYVWYVNAWDKRVFHNDSVFVLVDGEWMSPLFL